MRGEEEFQRVLSGKVESFRYPRIVDNRSSESVKKGDRASSSAAVRANPEAGLLITALAGGLEPLLNQIAERVAAIVIERLGQPGAGPERRFTESEAAQLLHVQPHTLRLARREGRLKFEKAGRFVRYRQSHLDAWLEAGGGE